MVITVGLHVRDDCVADHFRILAKSKGTESLLQLRGRWSHTKHDCRSGVPPERSPQDFGEWGVPERDVLLRCGLASARLRLESNDLRKEEERLVDMLALLDPQLRAQRLTVQSRAAFARERPLRANEGVAVLAAL